MITDSTFLRSSSLHQKNNKNPKLNVKNKPEKTKISSSGDEFKNLEWDASFFNNEGNLLDTFEIGLQVCDKNGLIHLDDLLLSGDLSDNTPTKILAVTSKHHALPTISSNAKKKKGLPVDDMVASEQILIAASKPLRGSVAKVQSKPHLISQPGPTIALKPAGKSVSSFVKSKCDVISKPGYTIASKSVKSHTIASKSVKSLGDSVAKVQPKPRLISQPGPTVALKPAGNSVPSLVKSKCDVISKPGHTIASKSVKSLGDSVAKVQPKPGLISQPGPTVALKPTGNSTPSLVKSKCNIIPKPGHTIASKSVASLAASSARVQPSHNKISQVSNVKRKVLGELDTNRISSKDHCCPLSVGQASVSLRKPSNTPSFTSKVLAKETKVSKLMPLKPDPAVALKPARSFLASSVQVKRKHSTISQTGNDQRNVGQKVTSGTIRVAAEAKTVIREKSSMKSTRQRPNSVASTGQSKRSMAASKPVKVARADPEEKAKAKEVEETAPNIGSVVRPPKEELRDCIKLISTLCKEEGEAEPSGIAELIYAVFKEDGGTKIAESHRRQASVAGSEMKKKKRYLVFKAGDVRLGRLRLAD